MGSAGADLCLNLPFAVATSSPRVKYRTREITQPKGKAVRSPSPVVFWLVRLKRLLGDKSIPVQRRLISEAGMQIKRKDQNLAVQVPVEATCMPG